MKILTLANKTTQRTFKSFVELCSEQMTNAKGQTQEGSEACVLSGLSAVA